MKNLWNTPSLPQLNAIKPSQSCIYKMVGNTGLPMNLYLPEKQSRLCSDFFFVMIHGGAWQAVHASDPVWKGSFLDAQARYYTALGFPTASISYRSIDFSPDTKMEDLVTDCRDALIFLKKRFGFRRFILLGESAGAHLALMLTLQRSHDIYAVIAVNPVTDLTIERWHFTAPDQDTRYRFSPLYQICPTQTKIFCLHGDADQVVDYHLSENFCEKMTALGNLCDFHLVPGAAHAFLLMGYRSTPEEVLSYMELIDAWLWQHVFCNNNLPHE